MPALCLGVCSDAPDRRRFPRCPPGKRPRLGRSGCFLPVAVSCRPARLITALISPSPPADHIPVCVKRRSVLSSALSALQPCDSGPTRPRGNRRVGAFRTADGGGDGVSSLVPSLDRLAKTTRYPGPSTSPGANSRLAAQSRCLDRRLIIKTARHRGATGAPSPAPVSQHGYRRRFPRCQFPPLAGRWQQRRRRGNAAPSLGSRLLRPPPAPGTNCQHPARGAWLQSGPGARRKLPVPLGNGPAAGGHCLPR